MSAQEVLDPHVAPCGLLAFDDGGVLLGINLTLANALGYAPEQLSGVPMQRLLPFAGRVFVETHVLPMLRLHGRVDEIFLTLRGSAGDELPVLLNGVRRGEGTAVRYECATFTIRRRGAYESELLWARRQAEEALTLHEELLAVARRREAELEEFAARARALARRVEELRDAEQQSVARSLHEGVAQELAGLRWRLDALQRGAADAGVDAAALASLAELAQRSLLQVRELSYEVHPPGLDAGLEPALRRLVTESRERSGLDVRMQVAAGVPRLPIRRALALYRFAHEALVNVERHAAASSATVELAADDAGVRVVVQDDGRGLPDDALTRAGALGLLGAAERLRALGGELTLDNANGGARVAARLPAADAAGA